MRLNYLVPVVLLLVAGPVRQLRTQVPAPNTLPPATYVLTLKEGDPAPPQAMGDWEFQVDSAGAYQWTRLGNVVIRGQLQVSADTVSLIDRDGDPDLVCGETGRYLWSMSPDGLRFAEIEDSCGVRPILLTSRALPRK